MNIAIIGSGGFAKEVLTILQDINARMGIFHNSFENSNGGGYNVLGFINENVGKIINGYPVIGTDETINETTEPLALVFGVGEPKLKEKIRSKYTNPLISFPTIIHPSVIIGNRDYVKIGEGCVICTGTIITTNIEIGDFVTVNLSSTIGHDTIIRDYCSFMPSVNISGEVCCGKSVYIGTGAKVINQVNIGENTIIGAGAIVTKDLPDNCTAVGIPAKPIKFHNKYSK